MGRGKKQVLVVFPTEWDRRQLESCRDAWEDRFEVLFDSPEDESCRWDFEILDYIEATVRRRAGELDGVMSTSDYPGAAVAAAIATHLGLPGSRPEAILTAGHKFYARLAQQPVVPEATPGFALVDPRHPGDGPPFGFPCFVKPVKGAFSNLAHRIGSAAELAELLTRPVVAELIGEYLHLFHQLVGRYTRFERGGSYFIAEELLNGTQVTVEGFVVRGEVEILGITDSIFHPSQRSFTRFDYPSSLPPGVQARMADITRRAVLALGLESTLFNVEMVWDETTDRLGIVETNPRAAAQFADLYHKVDGTHAYEIALSLAVGERPRLKRGAGLYPLAASFPLRVFTPVEVRRAPAPDDLATAEALFPGTLIWSECAAGQNLAEFDRFEDGSSQRYAVINLGAPDRAVLENRLAAVVDRLGFELMEK